MNETVPQFVLSRLKLMLYTEKLDPKLTFIFHVTDACLIDCSFFEADLRSAHLQVYKFLIFKLCWTLNPLFLLSSFMVH